MAIDKEKTLQAAQRAVEKKKYDLAIEEYRKLATAEKNDPRWLLKIGDLQQKKGDPAGAIGTYEEVARFYGTQGFHLKAVAVYNTLRDLLARQPAGLQTKYAHVPVRLAELYEKLQLTSDALATWDGIAERLLREGREREAVDVYRRIVGLDPSNPLAHLRLAEALSRMKDVEGAIAEFAATAEQLTAQGRIDDALKVYERLLHHRPDPRYAKPAAELYLQRNAPNDGVAAIAKIQVCLRSDPKSVELIALLARGFVAIGQNDKAVTIYKESARIAAEQGKHDLRRDVVKRLQALAPNDDVVRGLVAEVLGGQPSGARGQPAQPVVPAPRAQPTGQPAVEPARTLPHPQPVRAAQPSQPIEEDLDEVDLEEEEDEDLEYEEREAAEEVSEFAQGAQRSRGARVAEVIANADAFRKVKLFAKALTTLRIGLELDPRSIAIRERIRDILIETGETDFAIGEMVTLAAILLEDGDLQGAYDNLAWILEADPGHPQATRLMQQLQVLAGNAPASELEEIDVDEPAQPPTASRSGRFDELDDPGLDAPLPSYADDLEEEHTDLVQTGESLPSYDLHDPAPLLRTQTAPHAAVSEATAPESLPAPSGVDIEGVLDEADFYAAQGVLETARETVEEALRSAPNHPLLLEKLRELDEVAQANAARDARIESVAPASRYEDRAYDIAASLDALDDVAPAAPKVASGEQVDVEEVFRKFKLGVAEQVAEGDSQTHYDLGIAYDQMMLFDDAIAEFRMAARDPARAALCQSMIGLIFEKKGDLSGAIDAYQAGLRAERLTRDEELALLYQLSLAFEERKSKGEAIVQLKRILAIDPNYRDARARLSALEGASDKGSGARRRDDIDDELEAAFDNVIEKPKGK